MFTKNHDLSQVDTRAAPGPSAGKTEQDLFCPASADELQPTVFRMQPHQRIVLGGKTDEYVYAVLSGIIISRATLANSGVTHIDLNHSGDIVRLSTMPSLGERSLVAGTTAEVWRMKPAALSAYLAADPDRIARYQIDRERQLAAQLLRTTSLATMEGPERFAGFLLDMAQRIGIRNGAAIALDLPLSRTEIAQYLALNADTLSRLMSRLKAEGLVSQKSRHQIVLRDWRALAAQCPLSPAILALERPRPAALP